MDVEISWHGTVRMVLGLMPFGEDDRAGAREAAICVACALAVVLLFASPWHRFGTRGERANRIGSVLAAGAIGCEVVPAQRLFWVLAACAGWCAVYLSRHPDSSSHSSCPICELTGARTHDAS